MSGLKSFKDRLKNINSSDFMKFAVELYEFQSLNNPVYNRYLKFAGLYDTQIQQPEDFPFLPISLFKHKAVKTGEWQEQKVFRSSGTTGIIQAKHYIEDLAFYKTVSLGIFERFIGHPDNYEILALLPSYLERNDSSLVFMVENLVNLTGSHHSGFYLSNFIELSEKIVYLKQNSRKKIILWGVTFALLDFAENHSIPLEDMIIIETGGMKGRGDDLIREEVHANLRKHFSVHTVASEYGMTELMSQAYSLRDGIYQCPPWMKVVIREINDPFCICPPGEQGVINVIDLANIHSCAFIATEDLGRVHTDGTFEVLGRLDNSDLRGCNLLLS